MKVVINRCYGGFGLSRAAILAMREMGSEYARKEVLFGEHYSDGAANLYDDTKHGGQYGQLVGRNDPALVAVVERLGKAANGKVAILAVVEIPDDVEFEIDENNCGYETIHEKHRVWGNDV